LERAVVRAPASPNACAIIVIKAVKTGRRLIRHARYYLLQLAEGHLTRRLLGQIVGRIERLAWHST
jgi:hypothetical protein